jgi:dihydropteroate synthase
MGILNVTPDSFSDGGRFFDPAEALEQARRMLEEGAEVIDVGAESTRPGSRRIGADEQIRRLREVLPGLCGLGAVVSVDTTRSEVAEFALGCGAGIINDVSAGRDDPRLLEVVADSPAALVLMHMLGEPATMQNDPRYDDVVAEVAEFLRGRVAAAVQAGVAAERCIVDPGIGFGKRLEHNLALLAGTARLAEMGRPVLVGASRKRFLGEITGRSEPGERVFATVGACAAAWQRGATIFRVHDAAATAEALAVLRAVDSA